MSHFILHRGTLAIGGAAALAAATVGLSLYVTHHSAAALATGPGEGPVTLAVPGGATAVTLAPGAYHATMVLTDCGAVEFVLTTEPLATGRPAAQSVSLGREDAPYALTTPPPGWQVDPVTHMGPPHSSTHQTDFTVSSGALFHLDGGMDPIYNNQDCTASVTISPR